MRRNARMKRDVFLANIGTCPLIMGILNVTPGSFFDGDELRGPWLAP
jgi:dihydropteroate synthase